MFVKVVRKNRNGELRVLVLNTESIDEITEIDSTTEITKYSETTGEPVEYTETKRYVVGFNGKTYEITSDSAEALIEKLTK